MFRPLMRSISRSERPATWASSKHELGLVNWELGIGIWGFGAEAKLVLSLFPGPLPESGWDLVRQTLAYAAAGFRR